MEHSWLVRYPLHGCVLLTCFVGCSDAEQSAGGASGSAVAGFGGSEAAGAAPGGGAGSGGASIAGGSGSETRDAAVVPPDVAVEAGPLATTAAGNTCPVGQTYGNPLANNPMPTLVQNGVGFLEGPVWVEAKKLLYYTNFEGTGSNGRIRTYDPEKGTLDIFIEGIGANGMTIDGNGMLLAGFHEEQRVLRIDPSTKERTNVAGGDTYMGLPFNSINDVVARTDGHIYFTDPSYQKGVRPGQPVNASYHLSPGGIATRISSEDAPNGIAVSPDGKWLYIGGSGTPHAITKHEILANGDVMTPGTPISPRPSDGMTVDCAGNVYLTTGEKSGGKVTVLTPDGMLVGEVTQGFTGGTTNVSFGGADHKTLFVTTSDALFKVTLAVPGLP